MDFKVVEVEVNVLMKNKMLTQNTKRRNKNIRIGIYQTRKEREEYAKPREELKYTREKRKSVDHEEEQRDTNKGRKRNILTSR